MNTLIIVAIILVAAVLIIPALLIILLPKKKTQQVGFTHKNSIPIVSDEKLEEMRKSPPTDPDQAFLYAMNEAFKGNVVFGKVDDNGKAKIEVKKMEDFDCCSSKLKK